MIIVHRHMLHALCTSHHYSSQLIHLLVNKNVGLAGHSQCNPNKVAPLTGSYRECDNGSTAHSLYCDIKVYADKEPSQQRWRGMDHGKLPHA